MAVKVNLEMSVKCYKKLADFLSGHEYDIAIEENSWGELKELFVLVFDEDPSENC